MIGSMRFQGIREAVFFFNVTFICVCIFVALQIDHNVIKYPGFWSASKSPTLASMGL